MPEPRSADEPMDLGGEVATRVFRSPRELVFEAWTKTEHFMRWFGPYGVEVVSCEIDARPGGVICFTHRFRDGTILRVSGTFRDVIANARLDFTVGFVDEQGHPGRPPMFPGWPLEALIDTTVLLEEVEEGTRVTVRQHVLPASAASHEVVKHERRLAREGWTEVLTRLGEQLSVISARGEVQT